MHVTLHAVSLRCYGCEIDHDSQLQHDCLLPGDILIDMHFDETVETVNSTAVIRDRLTLLLEVDLRQSDVAPKQLDAINSWLEERWRHNVKRMILAALEFVNTCIVQSDGEIMFSVRLGSCFGNDL